MAFWAGLMAKFGKIGRICMGNEEKGGKSLEYDDVITLKIAESESAQKTDPDRALKRGFGEGRFRTEKAVVHYI